MERQQRRYNGASHNACQISPASPLASGIPSTKDGCVFSKRDDAKYARFCSNEIQR